MVIELRGVQFSLKSYARFQNREIDFTIRSSIATLLRLIMKSHNSVRSTNIYIYIFAVPKGFYISFCMYTKMIR